MQYFKDLYKYRTIRTSESTQYTTLDFRVSIICVHFIKIYILFNSLITITHAIIKIIIIIQKIMMILRKTTTLLRGTVFVLFG